MNTQTGYTFESVNQQMQAPAAANQNNPAFYQPPHQHTAGVPLSPHAPMFIPGMPLPNRFPDQDTGFSSQVQPNFPMEFYRTNPPPVNGNRTEHARSGTSGFHTEGSQDFAYQQQAAERGRYQDHYQNRARGRGRGQGNWRGRGRGGQDQFHYQTQYSSRGHNFHQVGNVSARRPRQGQFHANQRHSRDDYGDLYSHAYMDNGNYRNNRGGYQDSQPHNQYGPAGSASQRNVYVRKVEQYNNRENGSSGNSQRNENYSARGGRSGFHRDAGETPSQDMSGDHMASQYESRNRNGPRSAPTGKKTMNNSPENQEEGDRRVQMEEQLKRGRYECMVCCDNIRQEVAVWNCQKCYHVFHLRCIKQWVKSSLEADDDIWRCPACQNSNSQRPSGYRCFCGKASDPKFQPGETPHSCGEVCGRKGKEGCTHKCVLLCHPGPCPPCNAVVQRTCDCGAEKKSMRCGQIAVFKCEKVCGKDLNCSHHQCQVVCHEGDCLPCQVTLQQDCYGSHKKREVLCGSEEAIMLSYSCQQPCNKTLGCDNHVCEDVCHPGDCGLCPLQPKQVTHCCCGQTPLAKLAAKPRTNCLDPVPTCDQICNKPMACGPPDNPHVCQKKCHEGACGQCEGVTTLTCVCGANEKDFPCRDLDKFTAAEPFKCERRCNKKKMCGRHKCNELCCTRDVHICEVVCGHVLNCGLHKCEQLCHRGNCRPCLQASFEELMCHCGAEVMYPPIPCGTKPPACHKICTRQHNCDHPVRHTCHSDEACPPCTELVQKPCMGDHEVRKNVPCYRAEISCGKQCGKPLPCGRHKCIKTCHKGPCLSEEQNEVCEQPCMKRRRECGHPCGAPCHADTDVCPMTPCKAQMEIRCGCGIRTAKVHCQAGSNMSAEIAQFQRLTVQAMASGNPGQEVDISQLTVQKKNTTRQLECDSSCALIERNRRMALALEIQNPDVDAKLSGPKFSDFLKESAKKYPAFVAKVEKNFADLVQNAKQSKQPSRSFAFPSMNRDQRRIVHELAEAYGCETQSYDYEPNKNVVATAHRNKCWLPSATLSASISRMKAPPPIPHHTKPVAAWGSDKPATSLFKEKEKAKEKPEIDYFDFSSK